MSDAKRDSNRVPSLLGISSTDAEATVPVAVDPATNRMLVNATLTSYGLVPYAYDYISYTNTSTTVDTYTYKSGGAGGATVATLTITYTDTTKSQISTVART